MANAGGMLGGTGESKKGEPGSEGASGAHSMGGKRMGLLAVPTDARKEAILVLSAGGGCDQAIATGEVRWPGSELDPDVAAPPSAAM